MPPHNRYVYIVELWRVGSASAFTGELMDFFDKAALSSACVPNIIAMLNDESNETGEVLTELLGLFLFHCKDVLNDEQQSRFLHYYAKTCACREDTLRGHCAYNFPAMYLCLNSVSQRKTLHSLFSKLCEDKVTLHSN